jgi:hypothetical protein
MDKSNTVGFRVEADHYFEQKENRWVGEIRFTEFRQGKQYGGAVVETFKGRRNGSLNAFLKKMRDSVPRQLAAFWT